MLTTGGTSSLGGALKMVTECAKREVQRATADEKGDWRPRVFLMTDGYPTDDFQSGLDAFKSYRWGGIVACAAGSNADLITLEKITDNIVRLDIADASIISAYFMNDDIEIRTSYTEEWFYGEDRLFPDVKNISELPPPPPELVLVKR